MSTPPILRHDSWERLIAELARQPALGFLSRLGGDLARAVLAAPAALALWIARREPRLAAGGRLRLLVAGAEVVDAADQGRWYALVPQLLGAPLAVEATLVGAALEPDFRSAAAAFAPGPPARLLRMELADFLRHNDPGAFDLAVLFQPGLQKNRGWLTDGSLTRLLASAVPLVGSSYDTDEAEVDRWVLECHGYEVRGEALLNPFFLELGEGSAQVRWGRALWGFAPEPPAPGRPVDTRGLEALDLLSRMVMHSMALGEAAPFTPGAPVELRAGGGRHLALVHVFDRRFVDPATRRLLLWTTEGELRAFGELAPEDLAAYPGAGAREIERAMWAARIKCERLLAHYPAPVAADSGAARAAELLAALRERARGLFTGG